MDRTRGSNLICIRSRDLKNVNQDGSSGRLTLFEPINCDKSEKLFVCILSATFPNSFYNLSYSLGNHLLKFKETGDIDYKVLVIPDGSYDILELMSVVKDLLDGNSTNNLIYTLTYNEIDNEVDITHSDTTTYTTYFDFQDTLVNGKLITDTIRRFLGFLSSIQIINSGQTIISSDRAVDITDTNNSIYIRIPNLSNQKVIESSSGKFSNIVAHIPIIYSRNAFFTYEPPKPFCVELSQKTINYIDINITFQDENKNVNFMKGDWEINLLIEYKRDNLHTDTDHTYLKQLEKQVERYNKKVNSTLREQQELNDLILNANKNKT
jgi:hypothetical protein